MSILRGLGLIQVVLITSLSLIPITTLPSLGYCEENWIYVLNTEDFTLYYNSPSVKFDKKTHILKVWTKKVFTEKGKRNFLKNLKDFGEKKKYIDFHFTVTLVLFDCKHWKSTTIHIINYSRSGNVLYSGETPPKWDEIIPNTAMDVLLNRILEGYNIKNKSETIEL